MTEPEAFARRLDDAGRLMLGDRLVGTYLHGSAALGGFVPGRSDVDMLMVVDGHGPDADSLGRALVAAALPCPGRGVELSVVEERVASTPGPPWPFVVHVATEPPAPRIVVGAGHDGDPDLALHIAVCRAAGIRVSGPSAADQFGPVDHATVVTALRRELEWALTSADPTYSVLNACRAWRYVETGELVSKTEGAEWAMGLVSDAEAALVAHARDAQLDRVGSGPDRPAGDRFVQAVLRRLGAPGSSDR